MGIPKGDHPPRNLFRELASHIPHWFTETKSDDPDTCGRCHHMFCKFLFNEKNTRLYVTPPKSNHKFYT